jgi:membrane protease YdiL (CAAX protease family)
VPDPSSASSRVAAFAVALLVALLGWNNVVVPALPEHPASYVVVNVTATVVVLVLARSVGLPWRELGLDPGRAGQGARWGAACLVIVSACYAVALALPFMRPLLIDDRVTGIAAADLAWRVLVRIPAGTVLWEEVAFRGVLLAALLRLLPARTAVATSAAVFGVWHVRPTLGALAANDLVSGPVLTGLAVVVGCLATAVAGVLFCWLRLRSGSLVAPVVVHLATNSIGVLAAAAAVRLG